ncbi:MAG: polyprenyl synthetase family protein [Candidatus Aminicenantales bacterium]
MMHIEDRLLQKKEKVEQELQKILRRQDSPLFQAMRHAVFSGGKRFRPLLALACGECFELSEEAILPFACALEMIHNYSLIHDDLPAIDNDDWRRGQPSCHKAFGEDIALLAGDALLTLAFEVMSEARLEEKLMPFKSQIMGEISKLAGVNGLIGGQVLDITLPPTAIKEEEYFKLIQRKTGSLILAALQPGLILGQASSSQRQALTEYGKSVGLAFQIRDDIIDFSQEESSKAIPRPNSVRLFGMKASQQKLHLLIKKALRALNKAFPHGDELRFLALKLLDL